MDAANWWMVFNLFLSRIIFVVAGFPTATYHSNACKSKRVRSLVWERLRSFSDVSDMGCAAQCFLTGYNCKAFATREDKSCVLLNELTNISGKVWSDPKAQWKIYLPGSPSERNSTVNLDGKSLTNVTIRDAWLTGPSSDLSDVRMTKLLNLSEPLPLRSYYRHPMLDDWKGWNIKHVTVVLYTNSKPTLNLRFKGAGNSSTWFSPANLISSPWLDYSSSNLNSFRLTGGDRSRVAFINSSYDVICVDDVGWLVLLDYNSGCDWSNFTSFPRFLYVTSSKQNWLTGDIQSADDFVVLVTIEV